MAGPLILVNHSDRATGAASKYFVHRHAVRHRAFSVFIENDRGQLLLQQRAATKYHSGGLWANACCGHPTVGERVTAAALRRVEYEIGVHCPLVSVGHTSYQADFANGLYENEFVHLFHGRYNGAVKANATQASDVQWISPLDLFREVSTRPEIFTVWLLHYLKACWSSVYRGPVKSLHAKWRTSSSDI
jgi:isopentenyl-diphosphate delta-isomerase